MDRGKGSQSWQKPGEVASFIKVRRAVKKVDRWDLNGGKEVGRGGHLGVGGS